MKTTRQSGFHVIELAIVVLVVGVLGFAGYKVWDSSQTSNNQASQGVPQAPEINSTSDLTAASNTVDQLDTSSSTDDLNNLEQELSSLE